MDSSDINYYKSNTVNDTGSNGGMASTKKYTTLALGDIFSDVVNDEVDSGSSKYRKLHLRNTNVSNETLYAIKVWLDSITTGDDWVTMFSGTEFDVQSNITGSEDIYGCAVVSVDAASSSNTIVVSVEDSSIAGMFRDGGKIRITDMTDPLNPISGNEEFHVISGAPVVVGTNVTITTTDTLTYDYTAGDGRVMPILEIDSIVASFSELAESGSGAYDESNLSVNNIGTISQTWVLEFTSATTYTVTGSTVGLLPSTGSVSSDYSPTNTEWDYPYFVLLASGFSGTWEDGDTITFKTHISGSSIWLNRNVPSAVSGQNMNRFEIITDCQA